MRRIDGESNETSCSTTALTPLSFLIRSAKVWAARQAVHDGERSWTYAQHLERVERAIGALSEKFAVEPGNRVVTLLDNSVELIEMHYAVPGVGAVLVPLNTRFSASDYAYILRDCGACLVVATTRLRPVLLEALELLGEPAPRVLWVDEDGSNAGEYEAVLSSSNAVAIERPTDELALLSINYTSGTTGQPKGVMTSHRGAYLHTLGVIETARLGASSRYLWTLPMFHCNGWAYMWAVTASGATHVCLPRFVPETAWQLIGEFGVTHLCAAPTVVTMLVESTAARALDRSLNLYIGGAPPSPTLLASAAELNIDVTHLYGLTETYGPIAICAWNPDWDQLPSAEQFALRARQGVGSIVSETIRVVDEEMNDVPADGETLGEVVMRGNNVMLGYYRDPVATAAAFKGGWFHSGDLAVMHPDGYFELRDRLKDIVISGGENIATIEVEQALSRHPSVSEVAVVAAPDERWGEVPVAFVTYKKGSEVPAEALLEIAGESLARYKIPKRISIVAELPKTATGKIQKFVLREWAATLALDDHGPLQT